MFSEVDFTELKNVDLKKEELELVPEENLMSEETNEKLETKSEETIITNEKIEVKEDIKCEDELKAENKEIEIIFLSQFFNKYSKVIPDIKLLQIKVDGIDKDENVLLSVPKSQGKRGLVLYNEANKIPVLDATPKRLTVFRNNCFQIDHELLDGYSIKTYGGRGGFLHISQMYQNIPYKTFQVSRKELETIKIDLFDINKLNKLDDDVNLELIGIKYEPIKKSKLQFKTNRDVLNYFNELQGKIFDILHLIKIDSIICDLLI